MRILFDNQCFYFNGLGGVSRFFTELVKGLRISSDAEVLIQEHWLFRQLQDGLEGRLPIRAKGLSRMRYEWERLKNRRWVRSHLRASEADVFFPTYYDAYFSDSLAGVPFVVVVHDLIAERLRPHSREVSEKAALVRTAARVICVSEATRARFLETYPDVSSDRVSVIYHGNSIRDGSKRVASLKNPEFLLFVGQRHSYKRFLPMLGELGDFLRTSEGRGLVCVGGGEFSREEHKRIEELRLGQKVERVDASDAELAWLYQNAMALVSPSEEEGFGIPVLEAMANGCLLLLSDIPAYREVSGGHALFFRLEMPGDLSHHLQTISDSSFPGVRRAAQEWSTRFSWKRTGELTMELIRELSEGQGV